MADDFQNVEAIRKLRTQYSYFLDSAEVDLLADLFTDDAVCEFGPYGTWSGKAEIKQKYEEIIGPAREKNGFQSLHINTNHWIELTGENEAVGRVYLIDFLVSNPESNPLLWLGVYDESYAKVSGKWLIVRSSLQFLWPQRHVSKELSGKRFP